ncbi:diguanylate cyclase [Luteimonas sp. SJ-92]|uniref:diguanylate cyclase n=1 Tax=Luteimonas salinisoli TaxID=2752307 RepID=A0A853JG76_9GAMM|nr:ligand-binding sensor domain-containing diguanylate cyclase [Luteimonas salinisoli]NZA27754.1 diguanylate cyclase [Luteimonas salinisoli]
MARNDRIATPAPGRHRRGESLRRAPSWRSAAAVIVVAVAALLSAPAAALDPDRAITQYVLDHWGTREGLPHDVVRSIVQTRDGYLWLATQGGLARFDGHAFTVFDQANTPELGSDDIRSLFEAADGTLWIGTQGAGLLSLRDGAFTRYGVADGLGSDLVRCVLETRDGDLWICTSVGLTRRRDGRFRNYTAADGLPADAIYSAREDAAGTLWVGTAGGIARIDGERIVAYRAGEELPARMSLAPDISLARDGSVLAATYGGGIAAFADGKVRMIDKRDAGLADDRVMSVHEDGDGNLWVATYAEGLQRRHDGRWEQLDATLGLATNLMYTLYEDRAGSLWIGTAGGGLHRLRDGPVRTWTSVEGLPDDKVFAVHGSDDGGIWVGMEGGGVSHFDGRRFRTLTSADGLGSDNVISLASAPGGGLWIGTFNGGLSLRDASGIRTWTTADGLPANQVFCLAQDGDALWVGTMNGLARMRDGAFQRFGTAEGLGANHVRALLRGRDGAIWVGTSGGGLSRIRDDSVRTWSTPDGLPGNYVYALYEDARGVLWVGTKGGGLARIERGRIAGIGVEHGLADQSVYGIIGDDAGNLWLSGPRGLARAAIADLDAVAAGRLPALVVERFERGSGLRSGHTVGGAQPAAWKDGDGRLWFATFDGLAAIDPTIPRTALDAPAVYIETVTVDGTSVAFPAGAGAPARALPPGSHDLEIAYTGVDLAAPESLRFRYRLVGLDRNWVQAGSRRIAYFSRLPPGAYRFELMVARDGGPWLETEAAWNFRVLPAWYRTWWFAVLAALALGALAAVSYRLRVRVLTARARMLADLVAERTRDLEAARARFEEMSRTDALTGLPNRRDLTQRLASEWARAQRKGLTLAAVLVDVDHFKQFNDTHGHAAGDACLQRIAAVLREGVGRGSDVIGRWGGEEFLALLPDTEAEGAERVGRRICEAVAELAIPHPAAPAGFVSISAGAAAVLAVAGASADSLVARADAALYRAKDEGRNRVVAIGAPPILL